jgi:hypothetical protein
VVAAQLINARRERKRIQIEQEHEERTHWRNHRLDVYADFLSSAEEWHEAVKALEIAPVTSEDQDGALIDLGTLKARCREQSIVLPRLLARLDLMSTRNVSAAAHDAHWTMRNRSDAVEDGRWPTSGASAEDPSLGIASRFEELMIALRTDLGIVSQ